MPFPTGSAFAALRHRNYRIFLGGQLVSLSGTWMQNVALGWLVLTLTDSAFSVGMVAALATLPVLLFTLQAGALASRINRLRALTLLQSLMLLQAATLATLTWTGHATLAWISLLALAGGTLSAFEIPIRHTLLMDLVGRDDLMNAIALHSTAFNVARVLGPAFAGVLTASVGPALCFTLNAASYLAVLGSLLRIRPDPTQVQPPRTPPSLPEALAYVLAPGWPRALVLLTAWYTVFGVSFLTILPVYARDVLRTGAAGYGALTSGFGLGAAFGALLVAGLAHRFRREDLALRAGVVMGAALVLLGAVPLLPVALALVVAAGGAVAANSITTNTLLQTEAPEELRGRVIGVFAFIVVGMAPFGALLAGWVADRIGARLEVVIGGGACLVASLWTIDQVRRFIQDNPERRQTDEPPSSYPWKERRVP